MWAVLTAATCGGGGIWDLGIELITKILGDLDIASGPTWYRGKLNCEFEALLYGYVLIRT